MKGLIPIISPSYSSLGFNYENICKQVIGGKASPSLLIEPTGSYDESRIKVYLNTLCVGYNIDDQDKTALYTCNYDIIEQMNNAGYLVDANMKSIASALSPDAIAKKVKVNGYYGVRLDFESMSNGKPQYSVKVRHSLVEANKFLVVPLMFYFIYFNIFNQLASKCPVEVVTSWNGVDTKKIITTSPDLLAKAYANASPQAVMNKIKYSYVGVHPKTFHICGYSVQSSLDSVAPASFSLRAYKDINFVQKIDTSGNNVSDAYVYLYYRKCIMKQLKLGSKASFQFMNMRKTYNIEDGKNINDTARNWFIFAKRMSANQLYNFMMKYPQVFGDSVQSGIDNEVNKRKVISGEPLYLYFKSCITKILDLDEDKQPFEVEHMKEKYNIEDGETKNDTLRNWLTFAKSMPPDQLYAIMLHNSLIFGANIQVMAEAEMRKQYADSNESSEYSITDESLGLPADLSKSVIDKEFIAKIKKMLSSGAVQILYQSKGGDYTSMTLTNNMKVLESYYGENYVKDFESIGIRLALAKKMLKEGFTIKETDAKCGFLSEIGLQEGEVTPSDCISELTAKMESRGTKSKSKNEFIISCRSLTASNSADFWKSIDVRRIKECKYFI